MKRMGARTVRIKAVTFRARQKLVYHGIEAKMRMYGARILGNFFDRFGRRSRCSKETAKACQMNAKGSSRGKKEISQYQRSDRSGFYNFIAGTSRTEMHFWQWWTIKESSQL